MTNPSDKHMVIHEVVGRLVMGWKLLVVLDEGKLKIVRDFE